MIHFVLQKHCCAADDSFDLPLINNVNRHNFHFGRCEFCLVILEKIGNDVNIIDVLALIEDEEKFSKTKVPELIPRAVAWTKKAEFFKLRYFGDLFHKAPIELAPTKAEFQSNWYAPSYDFLCGLCESLLTLPKEVNNLRGRISKLESIIQVITLKINRIEKDESLNNFGPQIEDLLKSTSADEPDIKDNTSKIVEKDVGDVYCFDVNGHVPGVLMPGNPVSQPIYKDFSSDLDVLNRFCNLSQNEYEKGDCEIIRLEDQRQHDDISKMAEDAEQKIDSEIQRLYDHRMARLNKIAKEEKQRKFIGHMNLSAHMKLAIEHCVPKKRKYVDDLKRPFNRIDKIFLSHDLEECLSQSIVGHCKFPWCNDIYVDRSFWHVLCGLDDNCKGWLVNEHIELWIMHMWHTRPSDMDWGMVGSYFLPLLLQGSIPKFYANNAIYPIGWSNVERKIPVVVKETGVFEKKTIDPSKYNISFRYADHVPKQGGVFGDCGVFLCMFLYRSSFRRDELRFEVFFGGCLFIYPLDYVGEHILDFRLPKSKRLSYKEMNDLLLDKTKDDIWKWFYCKHKCSLEEGLTLVENDKDMDKMFQLANLHGTLYLYIGQIPQVFLVGYYFKNLCCVESNEEVTSMYRIHEKTKKDVSTMSLEELIAWEQEETQSPSYLRSPHVWKKNFSVH
nr:phospholipase-like protein [Tanacetum cinerariifolium]